MKISDTWKDIGGKYDMRYLLFRIKELEETIKKTDFLLNEIYETIDDAELKGKILEFTSEHN